MRPMRLASLTVVALSLLVARPAVAAEPNDDAALGGLKTAKAVYDVSVSDKRQLLLYLSVIKDAREKMVAKGIKPELVVVLRGASVTLVGRAATGGAEQQQVAGEIAKLVTELKGAGVRFEACAFALKLLKVDPASILPELHLVANTFNSAVGYQNKGYAVVTVF